MIWSVSTLERRSATARPVCVVMASMRRLLGLSGVGQVGGARQMAGDGGRGGHEWRDQMGSTALALPPLEVAVGGRRAALARRQLVGVHAQAHRAAGVPPLGTRLLED